MCSVGAESPESPVFSKAFFWCLEIKFTGRVVFDAFNMPDLFMVITSYQCAYTSPDNHMYNNPYNFPVDPVSTL